LILVGYAATNTAGEKRLSLAKDRRNGYDASPHGARKDIPRRKKLRNRANRHQQDSKLPFAPTRLEDDEADKIESSIRGKTPKHWKKVRDVPLGDVIAAKQGRRVTSHGRKVRSKVLQAFRGGHFCGNCPGAVLMYFSSWAVMATSVMASSAQWGREYPTQHSPRLIFALVRRENCLTSRGKCIHMASILGTR
jgi:hypothetical protein